LGRIWFLLLLGSQFLEVRKQEADVKRNMSLSREFVRLKGMELPYRALVFLCFPLFNFFSAIFSGLEGLLYLVRISR
jgi:hypothetical protein